MRTPLLTQSSSKRWSRPRLIPPRTLPPMDASPDTTAVAMSNCTRRPRTGLFVEDARCSTNIPAREASGLHQGTAGARPRAIDQPAAGQQAPSTHSLCHSAHFCPLRCRQSLLWHMQFTKLHAGTHAWHAAGTGTLCNTEFGHRALQIGTLLAPALCLHLPAALQCW